MKTARFTEAQFMAMLRDAESGVALPAVCLTHGISMDSFYKWCAKYGGIWRLYDEPDEGHGGKGG